MKRYICGFLLILILFCPLSPIIAEEFTEIPIIEVPIAEPATEPIDENIENPIQEPASDPIVEPIENPVVEPIEEPVINPLENPVTEPTEQPISDPTIAPSIVPTIFPSIVINEIMVGSEINPEKDVWIEFYNTTSEPINLSGWQIKGVTAGGRWVDIVNSPDISIPTNDYFLLSYYSNSSYSALNVKPQMTKDSLAFPNDLIEIELKNPNGQIIDKAVINKSILTEFRSYERNCDMQSGDMAESWSRATMRINLKENILNTYATPNSLNSMCQTSESQIESSPRIASEGENLNPNPTETQIKNQPITKIYPYYQLINEIMVNPQGDDDIGEWVEFYNGTSDQIDLSGWYLDDAEGDSSPYKINENIILGSGLYLVFRAPDLKLSMKNSDDQVRLLDPNKEVKEVIIYSGAKENFSYAKKPDSGFVWSDVLTPGFQNLFPLRPRSYQPDDVSFNSVLPNPEGEDEGRESVILQNNLYETINMSGWKIVNQKGKEYELNGANLSPSEKYTIISSEIGLNLTNKSDQLSLLDPADNLIDRINWTDAKNGEIIYKPDYFHDGMRAKVTNVIDGDTFSAIIDGDEYVIRLIGVDTPETVHPKKQIEKYGKEASDFLKNILTDQTVTLNFDDNKTDIYNRLLVYAYIGDKFVNAEIIKQGYGYAYTRFPFKYLNEFLNYEKSAKENKIGIWIENEIADILDEKEKNEQLLENKESDELNSDDSAIFGDCQHGDLSIYSIMPNAEKGKSVEYIKIINNGSEKVCLNGWKLDDDLKKGSKIYEIKGGSMQPGAIRTFRANETGLNLNNDDDCANLINPNSEIADQICFTKTHKNEIFSHDGGNWEPLPKVRLPNRTTKSDRATNDYQWELKNETLNGKIVFIYEEGEIIYLKTDETTVPVSYANSKVDIKMAKQLIDINSPIKLDVRSSDTNNELIAISQDKIINSEGGIRQSLDTEKSPIEIKYIIGLLVIVGIIWSFKKLTKKIMP